MANFVDATKEAMDQTIAAPARLGLRPYSVNVVSISFVGGSRPGLGTKSTATTRITIADGYTISDGYLNPHVKQVSSKDIFQSGNLLKDQDMVLGQLVRPYTSHDGYSRGTDIALFTPPMQTDPLEIYILITGPGLPTSGQYFKKIYDVADSSLSYKIFLRATGTIP